MQAWRLKQLGWKQRDIAVALDVTEGAVSQWMATARSEGPAALLARPSPGHPPKLGPDQLRLVPDFLSHGAEAYGFRGEVWTCARVAEVIQEEFGVSYHPGHVSRLLKELHWTPQLPIARAIQRDEREIEQWRVEVWPRLKTEARRERRTLVSNVLPSVVSVKTSKKIAARRQYGLDPFEFFFRNPRQLRNPNEEAMVQNSLGSGVVVTNEGHIITNSHVVDQVDEIEVQLSDGQTKKARLVGSDSQVDLAVLKIDEPGVKPLKLGDSDAVQAGDMVLAIGNPFGFEETVTEGIISSKGRPNRVDGFGDFL